MVTLTNESEKGLPHASTAEATVNTGVAGQLIVVGAGRGLNTGAEASTTMIVCEAVDIFPHASVAVHVRFSEKLLPQEPGVAVVANVSVKALPHASVAVATAKTGVAGQLIVVVGGNVVMTGAVTSCTLIVWEAVDELPHKSVTVQVRVALYEPEQAPGTVTVTDVQSKELPHASVAVGTAKTGTAGQLINVGTGKAPITGAVISCTLIVCAAVELLLHPSVALHVRVTLYEPAHAPFVVTSLNVKLKALPHASLAVATANTGVAGQLIVVGAGSDAITGAVIS